MVVPRPFGDLPAIGTPQRYVDQLAGVGLRPILIPCEHAVDLLDLVDAVVLTGGGDVDPAWSGVRPDHAHGVDRSRDDAEVALVREAAERRIPLLGCCRGLQVLTVAFGGTLHHVDGHLRPGPGHDVRTQPGSLISRLIGPSAQTTALHQQAIAEPGTSWRPTAWADTTIEAIEPVESDWPALGVQWHPELSGLEGFEDETGPALFGWLASAATAHRDRQCALA
jgi:putative glutamine amidotransferase